jgi:hypothetical protein
VLLDEIETNPILLKRFMDILIKELSEESDLRRCVIGVVKHRISCIDAERKRE